MAEERKISIAEVRKTISTSLTTAFGFVIALVWSNVILGGLGNAGIKLQPAVGEANWGGWLIFIVVAAVLTVVMIVLIIVIGRWGSKE